MSTACCRWIEARHGEVDKYDVPCPLLEALAHGLGGFDARVLGHETAQAQLFDRPQGIVFRVLDDQDSDRWRFSTFCSGLNEHTRLRPARLAAYSAASAREVNVSAVSPS